MRRKLVFAVVAILSGALLTPPPAFGAAAAPPSPDWAAIKAEQQQRQALSKQLDGRTLVVRVYPDPQKEPERFEKTQVLLMGETVQLGAERLKIPSASKLSLVLVWAQDQTDRTVAEALGPCLYTAFYGAPREESITTWRTSRLGSRSAWTFVDARGQPIPGATVEVRVQTGEMARRIPPVSGTGNSGGIPVIKGTTDSEGRLPWLSSCGMTSFIFKVEHTNYGVALVEYQRAQDASAAACLVPLVPVDAPEAALMVQGTVVDNDGRPVAEAVVSCYCNGRNAYGLTNTQGRFAVCPLTVAIEDERYTPPTPGTPCFLRVEPPPRLGLRRLSGREFVSASVGSSVTITLAKLETKESFHTFAFEYAEGPVTDPGELQGITVTLVRDGVEYSSLAYEQWKNGCALPPGVLRAESRRWGAQFDFPEIVLTADSPTQLAFRAQPSVVYRGQVVDRDTQQPLAGALVLADGPFAHKDPCSLSDEQWRQLRARAAEQAADRRPQASYQARERVAVTDADGAFAMSFTPGLNSGLPSLTAIAPGYSRVPPRGSAGPPDANGVVEVGVIELAPWHSAARRPVFVFEDETGPVTDPNRLKQIKIKIEMPGGGYNIRDYASRDWLQREFEPGVYQADAVWGRKHYLFEPVDLTAACPLTVVFRPRRILPAAYTYRGSVVHGLTGAPLAGVIVACGGRDMRGDIASVTPAQWTAIHALGARMEPSDLVLMPLLTALAGPFSLPGRYLGLTQTGADGSFVCFCEIGSQGPPELTVAAAPDFLVATQELGSEVWPDKSRLVLPQRIPWEPDENGVIKVPLLRLFPAATVLIHPLVPDLGEAKRGLSPALLWTVPEKDRPTWLQSLLATPRADSRGGLFRVCRLQANVTQSCSIPAGLNLVLTLDYAPRGSVPSACFKNIRLEQGQILDLGRVEPPLAVSVIVRVVDRRGQPISGVRLDGTDENRSSWGWVWTTDAQGVARINAPAHTSGRFLTRYYDRSTPKPVEESVPFQIGGSEDGDKEFTLPLSDEFLARLARPK